MNSHAHVKIYYKNHKGDRSWRKISPTRMEFKTTTWHPEAQWILVAWDVDKAVERGFAMKDISIWMPA